MAPRALHREVIMRRCRRVRTMPAPAIVALAALAALAGCDGADPQSAWSTTVDTLPNGAIRVVNTPPSHGAGPTWVIEEDVRIGTLDEAGPASFGQVKGVAPLEDGRIAVLDAQAQELRIFGPDGAHLATYGGKGAGPGELEAAFGLMVDPEGMLWVPDHRNARMSVFDPDTGFDRSYPLRVLSRGFIWGGVMGEDGSVLKPSITLTDRSSIVRVYDREMNLVDSLPLPPGPEIDRDDPPNAFTWGSREAGAYGMYGVPYFPQAQRLLDPRGVFWSTAFGDPSYRITRWAPGGDTTLVIETRREPVPVTAAERDSVIERVREQLLERGGANQDWSKIPDVKPAVAGLFLGEDGKLWVRAETADSLITYDVYERDGRYTGTAVTSLNLYLYLSPVVRGDRLWAVVTDELDVQYVVRARVQPAASRTQG